MTAYLRVEGRITGQDKYLEYRDAAEKTLQTYGGTVAVAGDSNPVGIMALEGQAPEGVTLVAFANRAQVMASFRSPEYVAARELRQNAIEVSLTLFDGLN